MIVRQMATACLIYLSLVMQSSLAVELAVYEIKPWFPGIALAACVLLLDGPASVIWAALLGLAVDGLSAERLGLHAIMVTFVATGLLMVRKEIRSMKTMLSGCFVFAGTYAWRGLSVITMGLIGRQPISIHEILILEFGSGVYTALIATSLLLVVALTKRGVQKGSEPPLPVLTNQWSMLTR